MGQQIETDARYAVLVEDAATINMMGFAYVCAVVRARAACSSPVSPPIHSSTMSPISYTDVRRRRP